MPTTSSSNQLKIDRLTHLVYVLEQGIRENKNFSLLNWYDERTQSGCAIGWAMLDPAFNNQGFVSISAEEYWDIISKNEENPIFYEEEEFDRVPSYEG